MTAFVRLLAILSPVLLAAQAPPPHWRDLNHNGRLDPYEDARLPAEKRVDDLLRQMTLEEKVGTMLHGTLPGVGSAIGASERGYDIARARALIERAKVTSFITRLAMPPADFAAANNAIQRLAEQSRLGIPVTISSDPRNHFQIVAGASNAAHGFSQWPETLGLAAIGDRALVRGFGQVVAVEYRAVGIHMALSPQADLFSEPRWSRGTGTFGSDPRLVSTLAGAYITGLQGSADGVTPDGVAAVVKHWVGYGAEPDGFDAHNYYGRIVRLDQASFAAHVAAFDGPLAARVAGVMPTYPIVAGPRVAGRPLEPVGAGFSRQLLRGLLRGEKGYRGLILSDWLVTADCGPTCRAPDAATPQQPAAIAMPWGVEKLSPAERFAKGVDAGIDQFGGVDDPAPLLAAVRAGKIAKARVDAAARRVLLLKFQLGLFDNPYVDPAAAARLVGNRAAQARADAAQRAAQVVLKATGGVLPLRTGARVWLSGVDAAAARAAGLTVADRPEAADVAIVRTATPAEKLHPYHFFGSWQHEGRLDFRPGDAGYEAVARAADAGLPVVLAVDMDRPAILTAIAPKTAAILALFGASDAALIDVLAGRATARGRMPFELPRSMDAVVAQDPARPDDSADPLYPRGAGIDLPPATVPAALKKERIS